MADPTTTPASTSAPTTTPASTSAPATASAPSLDTILIFFSEKWAETQKQIEDLRKTVEKLSARQVIAPTTPSISHDAPPVQDITALARMPTPPPTRSAAVNFPDALENLNFTDMSAICTTRTEPLVVSQAHSVPAPMTEGVIFSRPFAGTSHVGPTFTSASVETYNLTQTMPAPGLPQNLPIDPQPEVHFPSYRRSTGLLDPFHAWGPSSSFAPAPARIKVSPKEYDGKEPWRTYRQHFDAVARANGWTPDHMAICLAPFLRGTAQAFYQTLPFTVQASFILLDKAFDERFSAQYQQSVAHIQLRGRVQKDRETLAEYATDVQRLVYLAFPDCPESAKGRIALGQFVDGLADAEVQQRVRDTAPETLEAALALATRMEASRDATRISRKHIRVAQAELTPGIRPAQSKETKRSGKANRSA